MSLIIPIEPGEVSDGYHTFNELYDHRCILFIALMQSNPELSWRSQQHADGEVWEGWFIAGMELPTGDITYHLPMKYWDKLNSVIQLRTRSHAPEWDGHTPADVINYLSKWIDLKKEKTNE